MGSNGKRPCAVNNVFSSGIEAKIIYKKEG